MKQPKTEAFKKLERSVQINKGRLNQICVTGKIFNDEGSTKVTFQWVPWPREPELQKTVILYKSSIDLSETQ